MRRSLLLCVGALALTLTACQSSGPAAHNEEPYVPRSAPLDPVEPAADSLDSMEYASASGSSGPASYGAGGDTGYSTLEPGPATEPQMITSKDAEGYTVIEEVLSPGTGNTYVVRKGDTLFRIARLHYNDQSRWRQIWQANQTRVPDPDQLAVGTRLIIP